MKLPEDHRQHNSKRGDLLLEGIRMDVMLDVAFETDNEDKDGDGELKIPEPRCERRSGISLG